MTTHARVAALLDEFSLTASDGAAAALASFLDRGIVGHQHLQRTFASLRDACALPRVVDEKFARHFGAWLEVINQPYFKPIITSPHRLDDLIANLLRNTYVDVVGCPATIVDLGTGQPPYTTIELADSLPLATVHGFDLYNPSYQVLWPSGEYALFCDGDRLAGVHAPTLEQLHALVIRWGETTERFTNCLMTRVAGHCSSQCCVAGGCELVHRPTDALQRRCRNPHLRFHVNEGGGFDLPQLEPASVDVVWSFNCLLHYELAEREAALRAVATRLREGGIVFEGYTSPRGAHAVFSVWQRRDDRLHMREFGFSLPNLRVPLWPLHARDPQVELLNRLLATIKRDVPAAPAHVEPILQVLRRNGYDAKLWRPDFVVLQPRSATTARDFPTLAVARPVESRSECVWAPA